MTLDRLLETVSDLHEENQRLKAELATAKGLQPIPPELSAEALCHAAAEYLKAQHWSPASVAISRVQRPPEKWRMTSCDYELVVRFTEMRRVHP
jgi:hypothetical protein